MLFRSERGEVRRALALARRCQPAHEPAERGGARDDREHRADEQDERLALVAAPRPAPRAARPENTARVAIAVHPDYP